MKESFAYYFPMQMSITDRQMEIYSAVLGTIISSVAYIKRRYKKNTKEKRQI